LNILDIAILFFVGTTYVGFHTIINRKNLNWLIIICATRPFTETILFIVTKSAWFFLTASKLFQMQ